MRRNIFRYYGNCDEYKGWRNVIVKIAIPASMQKLLLIKTVLQLQVYGY